MNHSDMKLKAYSLSFILHFLLLVMILFFASTFNKEQKIIEVNLNIEDFRIEKPSTKEEIKGQEKHSYKSMPEKLKANQSQIIKDTKEETNIPPMQTQEVNQPVFQKDKDEANQYTQAKSIGQTAQAQSNGEEVTASKNVKKESKEGLSKEHAQEMFLKEKLSVISSIIQKNISYPPLARKMGWEGKVIICIHLRSDGTLEDVKIERSSGYDLLDRDALETVKKVAHLFPRPPVDVIVRLPVSYKLE